MPVKPPKKDRRAFVSDLDKGIKYFYDNRWELPMIEAEFYHGAFGVKDIGGLPKQVFHKLISDGYIINENDMFYSISGEGIIFFERYSWIVYCNSPYRKENIAQNTIIIWRIVKIITASAVAIITISIAVISLALEAADKNMTIRHLIGNFFHKLFQ